MEGGSDGASWKGKWSTFTALEDSSTRATGLCISRRNGICRDYMVSGYRAPKNRPKTSAKSGARTGRSSREQTAAGSNYDVLLSHRRFLRSGTEPCATAAGERDHTGL